MDANLRTGVVSVAGITATAVAGASGTGLGSALTCAAVAVVSAGAIMWSATSERRRADPVTDPAQVRMDDLAAERVARREERWAAERAHSATINWTLINALATKPHKHLNMVEGEQYGVMVDGVFDSCCNGVGEVMQEARTVHHLLDLAGIPEGHGYSANVDARAYLAVKELGELRDRLARIAGWHAREAGEGGTVGDFCTECGTRWPCDTRRMAEGTYDDEAAAAEWSAP